MESHTESAELSMMGGDDSEGKHCSRKDRKYQQAIQGLCLFCNNNFPRNREAQMGASGKKHHSNIPKFKRSFGFLAAELGVNLQIRQGQGGRGGHQNWKDTNRIEFSFISENVPLCSNCLKMLEQVNSLFLKLQSVKYQLQQIVSQIRELVIKSRSKTKQIYTEMEMEKESHFNIFRAQVVEELQDSYPHPCDLNISLPDVKVKRLKPIEVERYSKDKPTQSQTVVQSWESEEDDMEVDDLNFSNLVDDEYLEFNQVGSSDDQDDVDIKPDVSELVEEGISNNELIKLMGDDGYLRPVSDRVTGTNNSPLNSTHENVGFSAVQSILTKDLTLIELNAEEKGLTHPETLEVPLPSDLPFPVVAQDVLQHSNLVQTTPSATPPSPPASTKKKKWHRTIYPKPPDEDDCKLCNIPFKTQKQLADHYKSSHPTEFPRKCPEPGCEYGTHFPNAIRKHILQKHSPDEVREAKKNMICDQCGKKFFSRANLRHHILMHKGERPFSCPQCGKTFRCKQAVDVHVFRIHENVRNFPCPHCPWKFKDHVSLRGHIAIHTGEKNHVCHICGVKKIQKHALQSHWRVHKKKGDWVLPPDFNKRRGGWVKKKKQNTEVSTAITTTASNNGNS